MLSLSVWTDIDKHTSPGDRMVPKDKSTDVHTHSPHPPQPHDLETTVETVMILDSEGKSLQQGDGKRIR